MCDVFQERCLTKHKTTTSPFIPLSWWEFLHPWDISCWFVSRNGDTENRKTIPRLDFRRRRDVNNVLLTNKQQLVEWMDITFRNETDSELSVYDVNYISIIHDVMGLLSAKVKDQKTCCFSICTLICLYCFTWFVQLYVPEHDVDRYNMYSAYICFVSKTVFIN